MQPRRSIIVPCYNEAENIPNLLRRFDDLRNQATDWELVLVNNGSTDDSAAVFSRELRLPHRSYARVVTVEGGNVGYGHGIMTGLRAAVGEFLAWTHADGQTPPSDVLKALSLLEASADPQRTFVKGRRRGRATKDVLFTFGMQVAAQLVLAARLVDINAQPKAFHRELLSLATRPPVDLSLDLYFFYVARRAGFAIKTLDVEFGAREFGESKWAFNWKSKARNISRTVRFMRALRRGESYRSA